MDEEHSKSIPEALEAQARQSDQSWRHRLQEGKLQAGTLQVNLAFLEQSGLLGVDQKILEIGCGVGTLVYELTQKGYSVIGTDISREAIDFGREKYPGLSLEVQAAQVLHFPNHSFDRVLSFDVFEHIPRIDPHLEEVRRILRPGGYYLFQTPNKYSNILFETLKSRSLQWRQYHPSLHTPGGLRRRLSRHGFMVQFVKMNTMNEFSLQKLRRFGPLAALCRHIDFRRLPLPLQTNLYVIARKKDL